MRIMIGNLWTPALVWCVVLGLSPISRAGLTVSAANQAAPAVATTPSVLLPPHTLNVADCSRTDAHHLRSLLIGVDQYGDAHTLTGPSNDANLFATVLKSQGSSDVVEVIGTVTRDAAIQGLMQLSGKSRCGDTVFIYYGGNDYAHPDYQWVLSDYKSEESIDKSPLLRMKDSPARRMRRAAPGTIDGEELHDYLDAMRDNGVNVILVVDTSYGRNLEQLLGNDEHSYWVWQDSKSPGAITHPPERGAYFGMFAGDSEVEFKLPPNDPNARTHGMFSWAVAFALKESGTQSFRSLAQSIAISLRQVSDTSNVDGGRNPTLVASHPDRSPFATGLASAAAVSTLTRGAEDRRIDITNPAVARGFMRVGEGDLVIEGRVISQTAPTSIVANQVAGQLNRDGTFRITLPMHEGENRINLAALWGDTDFVPKSFTVISQPGKEVVQEGRRYAVLIANEDYQDPAFAHLSTPVADSHAIAKLLTSRYGFVTQVMIAEQPVSLILDNASRSQINHVLSQLRSVVAERDSLLIYYAGHGVHEKETNRAYWLPVDARKDEPADWVSDEDVTAALDRLTARHVLIIADSCFSGGFKARGDAAPRFSALNRLQYLDQASTRASRYFISSGADEPVADDNGRGHSPFAQALINGLSEENKPFTGVELFTAHVQSTVGGEAKQVPQYWPLKDGNEGGEFVFIPGGGTK